MRGKGLRPAGERRPRAGRVEWAAVFLLPAGSIVFPVLGWLAGVVLLWNSRVWSTREKLIGTLVVPGGLSSALYLALIARGSLACAGEAGKAVGSTGHCRAGGWLQAIGTPGLIGWIAAGFLTPLFLALRATGWPWSGSG